MTLPERVRYEIIDWTRFLIGAGAVYLTFTTAAFAQFHIPSESMQPTLEVGDRVIVSKFAYGWSRHSLPLGLGDRLPAREGRFLGGGPERGDVVVFRHPVRPEHVIKRVVGLPGDVVEVRQGRVYLNGAPAEMEPLGEEVRRDRFGQITDYARFFETLPGDDPHWVYDAGYGRHPYENLAPYTVPEGRVFLMGDNRDNSVDSRALASLGPVPIERLVGKAQIVVASFHQCSTRSGVDCPGLFDRLWRPL
ncbi:MAG: signal peptidase I [Maricaulaceae bacterium]